MKIFKVLIIIICSISLVVICFFLIRNKVIKERLNKEQELENCVEIAKSQCERLTSLLIENNILSENNIKDSTYYESSFDDINFGIMHLYDYYYYRQEIALDDYLIFIVSKYYPNSTIDKYAFEIHFNKPIEFSDEGPTNFEFSLNRFGLFLDYVSEFVNTSIDCGSLSSYYNKVYLIDDFMNNSYDGIDEIRCGYKCYFSTSNSISYEVIKYIEKPSIKRFIFDEYEGYFSCKIVIDYSIT